MVSVASRLPRFETLLKRRKRAVVVLDKLDQGLFNIKTAPADTFIDQGLRRFGNVVAPSRRRIR